MERASCTHRFLTSTAMRHVIPISDFNKRACPPPDFPERGRYEPVKADYEVGQTIYYHCDPRLPMIDANHVWLHELQAATCEASGKWSRGTPFCAFDVTPSRLAISIRLLDGDLTAHSLLQLPLVLAHT
uniref:Sushi domain-containing protein n=2 Tax=Araneus ventricosus TaxID=182803 RepID=A0A4Y2M8D2_ARAVE|nr:hypothetical protein AVEN_7976-1 [Araneus ventricosus]